MSHTMNDVASRQLSGLYETIEKHRFALVSLASSNDEAVRRISSARHNAWLHAKSVVEEAVYLFLELGGCWVGLGPVPMRSRAECDPAALGLAPALKETPIKGDGQAAETAFRHLLRAVTYRIGQLRLEEERKRDDDIVESSVRLARLDVWKQVLLLVGDACFRFQVEAHCGEAARLPVPGALKGYIEEGLSPERGRYVDPDIEFG